jgi:hypothetical protein
LSRNFSQYRDVFSQEISGQMCIQFLAAIRIVSPITEQEAEEPKKSASGMVDDCRDFPDPKEPEFSA